MMSPIRVDEDLLPTTTFALPLKRLEPALRLARRRVQPRRDVADGGPHPHRRAAATRMVVAHRRRARRARRPRQEGARRAGDEHERRRRWSRPRARRTSDTPVSLEYVDADSRSNLGVAARIPSLGWTVIVEQPTSEAYATATAASPSADGGDLHRAARHGGGGLRVRAVVHQPDPQAEARHAGSRRRPARQRASTSAQATSSPSSATPSTRWRTASWSSRRTSSARSGRRCSAGSPRASCTTSRIRFRTSATARA